MIKKNASHATDKYPYQANVKLTEEDMNRVLAVNTEHFEGDASVSMLIRVLVRKGLDWYAAKDGK
jgi:hypothetical protein